MGKLNLCHVCSSTAPGDSIPSIMSSESSNILPQNSHALSMLGYCVQQQCRGKCPLYTGLHFKRASRGCTRLWPPSGHFALIQEPQMPSKLGPSGGGSAGGGGPCIMGLGPPGPLAPCCSLALLL